MKPIKIADYRQLAKKKLPRMVFDYLDGGAEDEDTIRNNRDAITALQFRPKRLLDVSQRNQSIKLFNKTLTTPMAIAPTGLNGVFWPKGDLALARAAAKAGIPFSLSTASNETIEDVARSCDGEKWFQLYVVHRTLAKQLVERALAAGYTTLILTTDVAVNGYRERDLRNQFGLPIKYTPKVILDGCLHPRWSLNLLLNGVPELANFKSANANDTEVQAALLSRQMDASFSWKDLKWLRDLWPHTLLVKGLIANEDVEQCKALGVDGVILSNHGGRQLDTTVSPFQTLQEITPTDYPVIVDSGIRRGADVVKALALGAQCVMLGRSVLYPLAANGEQGVLHAIELLKDEIDRTLANLGCADVNQLDRSFLNLPPLLELA